MLHLVGYICEARTHECQNLDSPVSQIYFILESEKLVHLVGFTIEIYYDARPYERHICFKKYLGLRRKCGRWACCCERGNEHSCYMIVGKSNGLCP